MIPTDHTSTLNGVTFFTTHERAPGGSDLARDLRGIPPSTALKALGRQVPVRPSALRAAREVKDTHGGETEGISFCPRSAR